MRAILRSSLHALPAHGQLMVATDEGYPKGHFTEYFVNAPPACVSEFGPSAA